VAKHEKQPSYSSSSFFFFFFFFLLLLVLRLFLPLPAPPAAVSSFPYFSFFFLILLLLLLLLIPLLYVKSWVFLVGRDSSVGITIRYALDGQGSNPGGGEIFCTRPDRP